MYDVHVYYARIVSSPNFVIRFILSHCRLFVLASVSFSLCCCCCCCWDCYSYIIVIVGVDILVQSNTCYFHYFHSRYVVCAVKRDLYKFEFCRCVRYGRNLLAGGWFSPICRPTYLRTFKFLFEKWQWQVPYWIFHPGIIVIWWPLLSSMVKKWPNPPVDPNIRLKGFSRISNENEQIISIFLPQPNKLTQWSNYDWKLYLFDSFFGPCFHPNCRSNDRYCEKRVFFVVVQCVVVAHVMCLLIDLDGRGFDSVFGFGPCIIQENGLFSPHNWETDKLQIFTVKPQIVTVNRQFRKSTASADFGKTGLIKGYFDDINKINNFGGGGQF